MSFVRTMPGDVPPADLGVRHAHDYNGPLRRRTPHRAGLS